MMPLRLTCLWLSSSLLAAAALGGCAEPRDPRFADASLAQLERTFEAASGVELGATLLMGISVSGQDSPDSCPKIVTTGPDTTATGGCTIEDGVRMEGSIRVHNLPGVAGPAYDPSQPGSVEIDVRFTHPQGEDVVLDGRVELDGARISGDLTVDAEGITSTSRLALTCKDQSPCTPAADSEIEISGLGRAGVEGMWRLGPPSGRVTARGTDVIVFDIDGRDGEGCVPYTINGVPRGPVCIPGLGEADELALVYQHPMPWSKALRGTLR